MIAAMTLSLFGLTITLDGSIFYLRTRTSRPIELNVAEKGSTKSPSGILEVTRKTILLPSLSFHTHIFYLLRSQYYIMVLISHLEWIPP